jgi:hypothetical protein
MIDSPTPLEREEALLRVHGRQVPRQCNKNQIPPFSWKHNDTAINIELVRPFFHFSSWEFGGTLNPLKDIDWENPNLVSVIVMLEPISWLLAD